MAVSELPGKPNAVWTVKAGDPRAMGRWGWGWWGCGDFEGKICGVSGFDDGLMMFFFFFLWGVGWGGMEFQHVST